MDRQLKQQIKEEFKFFGTNLFFYLAGDYILFWATKRNGFPSDTIELPHRRKVSPNDIKEVVYEGSLQSTAPGKIKIIGVNGDILLEEELKEEDHQNYAKNAEEFNKYLALYKQYNLGK